MAIGIAGTHRRNGKSSLGISQELRDLMRRTVMRDLQHVGGQRYAVIEDLLLRRLLGVAGQQCSKAGHPQPHDDGRVVGVRIRAVKCACGHHLPAHRADGAKLVERHQMRLDPGLARPLRRPGVLLDRLVQRTDLDLTNRAVTEYAGQTLDMISVVVRQHDQRQPAYTESAQTSINRIRVRPAVEEHRLARRSTQHHCVALTDVADDHCPVAGRPRRRDDVDRADPDRNSGEHRSGRATCLVSVHEHAADDEHDQHRADSGDAMRPAD
jgi:hypothetical protein